MGKAIKFANNQKQQHMKRVNQKFRNSILVLTILVSANSFTAFCQSSNHTCGASNVHNSALTYGQISDVDGNTYKTIVIDDKVWFSENLKVTRFQNGDAIPQVSDSAMWSALTGPGMCSYRNDNAFDCPYGKLYNHHVARDPRNPCPSGWRVPSMTDLYDLIFFLDPNANAQQPGNQPNMAGGQLKSAGLAYYQPPNAGATNSSGFSAIPNGGRNPQGQFSLSYDAAASYWLSTQVGPGMGFFLELGYPQDWAVRNAYFSGYGICIRCVTDLSTLNINETHIPTFYVYPNPAGEYIKINSDKLMIGKEYVISDVTGRQLLRGRILSEDMTVSIIELPSGMYFLSFPSSSMSASKIIKR
ncbi:FISUMP domain-containing protein [Flavobacterium sp.]|jgi:uncharacterized protein (TIGR02145 family)|uniref:FISUMP domain-containing protein n=1 Tax=Flavobacterium sp. TaxID=239 RepID=UPI0037C167E6